MTLACSDGERTNAELRRYRNVVLQCHVTTANVVLCRSGAPWDCRRLGDPAAHLGADRCRGQAGRAFLQDVWWVRSSSGPWWHSVPSVDLPGILCHIAGSTQPTGSARDRRDIGIITAFKASALGGAGRVCMAPDLRLSGCFARVVVVGAQVRKFGSQHPLKPPSPALRWSTTGFALPTDTTGCVGVPLMRARLRATRWAWPTAAARGFCTGSLSRHIDVKESVSGRRHANEGVMRASGLFRRWAFMIWMVHCSA